MIKINLLGNNTGIDHSGKYILLLFIAVGFCLIIGILYLNKSARSTVDDLRFQFSTLNNELKSLEQQTKAATTLQRKRSILEKKLTIIAKLKKNKTGPVRIMDDLNLALPKEVWLREVIERNRRLKIRGRALSNEDIAVLMNNLEKSNFFYRVDLVQSKQMYYVKSTGRVTSTQDIANLASSFDSTNSDSRVTKVKKKSPNQTKFTNAPLKLKPGGWSVSDDTSKGDVTIKEFILNARVSYDGNLREEIEKLEKEEQAAAKAAEEAAAKADKEDKK